MTGVIGYFTIGSTLAEKQYLGMNLAELSIEPLSMY